MKEANPSGEEQRKKIMTRSLQRLAELDKKINDDIVVRLELVSRVLDLIKEVLIVCDQDDRIAIVNARIEEMLGYEPEGLHGVEVQKVIPSGLAGPPDDSILAPTGIERTLVVRKSDGTDLQTAGRVLAIKADVGVFKAALFGVR